MRLSEIIDAIPELAEWPLKVTENSSRKFVRIAGVLGFAVLFFPVMLLCIVVGGILAIPAMIQDA